MLEGVLPALYQNLFRARTEVIKETLWGLSNLCCCTNKSHINYILENEDLIMRVIELMQSSSYTLVIEATWVMSNALTECTP